MEHQASSGSIGLTSASLLARVNGRDPAAWSRLSKLYGPLVYQWCRRCGLSPEDSADVAQEVFGVLVQKLAEFRHDQPSDSFRGWLWTITRNKVRDHARKSRGRAAATGGTEAYVELQQVPETADEPWQGEDERSAIDHGLAARALGLIRAEFETNTWQAFWKSAVDGRTAAEISQELGMTKHAVHQAKYRVLRRLRAELG